MTEVQFEPVDGYNKESDDDANKQDLKTLSSLAEDYGIIQNHPKMK